MATYYPPPPPQVYSPPLNAAVEIDNRPFWEKYKYVIIGVSVLIMLIILGLIIKAIFDAYQENKATSKAPSYQMIVDPATGDVVVTNDPLEGYDPLPLANRLLVAYSYNSWFGWGASERCAATKEADNLSTNKLIAVAVQYKKLNKGVSLHATLSDTAFDGCSWTDNDPIDELKTRLLSEKLT